MVTVLPMIAATAITANIDALMVAVVVNVGASTHLDSDDVSYVSVTNSSPALERLNPSGIFPFFSVYKLNERNQTLPQKLKRVETIYAIQAMIYNTHNVLM